MNSLDALRIIKEIASGINPYSGERLIPESVFERADTIRALFLASVALEEFCARERRRNSLPANTGRAWTTEEDQRLTAAFDVGTSLKVLAGDHRRTITSVRLRLLKLGKVNPGIANQRTAE